MSSTHFNLYSRKLKKVSNEYSANHERATSALSRHRMVKGLREVADDKATLWREECRNFELGYSQERPEFEQMKNIHSILKASMDELVERNKYLVSFVKLIKRRRLKQYEEKYRNQVGANHSGTERHMLRQQFEEAVRNQLDLRNMGNPALRKGLDFQDQMKRFGRSLPRPPFAPLNVFKLNALAPYLGRSCVRYGGGKVYTLKVDINKHMLKDEETFGRTTPETKDHWILSGKNCLHDPENVLFGDCVLSQSEMFGYSKLPSIRCEAEGRQIGEGRTGHISAPRTSIVKHVATKQRHSSKVKRSSKCMTPLKTATHGNQKKPKSKPYSGKKSHFGVSLNNWGHQDEVGAESVTKGDFLTHGQPVRHAESSKCSSYSSPNRHTFISYRFVYYVQIKM